MPLVAPFEASFGRETVRDYIIVDCLPGCGGCVVSREPGYNYETTGTAWHILKDFIEPLVLGQDGKDAYDFQHRVERIHSHYPARVCAEMALWDLLVKRDGKSLKETV